MPAFWEHLDRQSLPKGTTMAKSEMFENLKNLSKSMASECDLIKANVDRVAIPLAGDNMPFDISKNLC